MLTQIVETSDADLTSLQSGMLFHAISAPGRGVDTEHIIMELHEELDVARFEQAWQIVVDATPALRASFLWKSAGGPRRLTNASVQMRMVQLDLSALSGEGLDAELDRVQRDDRATPFALDTTPMRLTVAKIANGRWWVLWSFHHILLDGRSFPLVLRALFGAYDHGHLVPDRPNFDAFVATQAEVGLLQATSWQKRLAGFDPQPSLSVEPFAGVTLTSPFGAVERRLDVETTEQLRSEAKVQDCTLNNLVQAAWAILLQRYLGTSRVTFGTTRACRHVMPEASEMIGLLINTVPFTVDVDREANLEHLTASIRTEHLALRSLESTSLTDIKRASGLDAGAELFESLLMFDDASLDARLQDLGSNRTFHYIGQTNFPLAALVYGDNELLVRIEFDRERFSDAAATRIADQLCVILGSMIQSGSRPVGSLSYLTEDDKELLTTHNNTSVNYDGPSDLVEMFEAQVEKTPDAVALTMGGAALSFAELNSRANRLARTLVENGVTADSVVGLYARRSFEQLIAVYAIVKAGGAYLPLDPEYPTARLQFMIEDAQSQIVLAAGGTGSDADRLGTTVIDLDGNSSQWSDLADTNLGTEIAETDAAYVLFTSGSTGKPKGVINEHRGIMNRLRWMQDALTLTSQDVILHKTPFTFDVSVWELFWPLQVGATLAIAAPDAHRDPRALVREIQAANVTTMHFVPSMLALFVEEPSVAGCESLTTVICSGEALTRDLQDRALSRLDVELHNLYGPTEAAIDVTWWRCDPASDLAIVPIGFAIANTTMHIVDRDLQLVPPGAQGELLIGGTQVARGYLRRPDLNAERFLNADILSSHIGDGSTKVDPSSKLYRTGDLGRYRADGSIEYLGRTDHQVKIRGLRIELGEIEAVIAGCDWVSNCVVIDREDRPGHKQLAAYVVGNRLPSDPGAQENELRVLLGGMLADYMVPSTFTFMAELPLSTAGKVDRTKLPRPVVSDVTATRAPEGPVEQKIAAIWSRLLGHSDIDRTTPFFQAGGHSLMVIELAQKLSTAFNQDVGVTDLIDRSTVAAQAEYFSTDTVATDQQKLATVVAQRKRGSTKRKRARRTIPRA